VTLQYARGYLVDRSAVGDIARLVLVGARRPARETDDVPFAALQLADELGAEPRGSPGDDRYLQTRSWRPAAAWCPAASRTVAVRWCTPFFRPVVFQTAV
jgi:hypothetical protein